MVESVNQSSIINDIIDQYINSTHNICGLMSNIMLHVFELKIYDEKLIQLVNDFLNQEKNATKLEFFESYYRYFVNFAILLFEYWLTVDYISTEKKAILFVSIFKILYDSFNPEEYKVAEKYNSRIYEFHKKIDDIVINKIIKQKNDELFYFMIEEAFKIDNNYEPVCEKDCGEISNIDVVTYFECAYLSYAKKYELIKSIEFYNSIKDNSEKDNIFQQNQV